MLRRGAVALAALFLVLHLPFLPGSLEDLDSINFALGMRHFDVAQHQPHPPGYPLFIAIANLVHLFVPSEAASLALVSVLGGALSVFALVAIFNAIDDHARSRPAAFVAALLTLANPLYWFTASRPLSDVPGLAAALGVQALLLTATTTGRLAAAGFLAALAAGLRSQVLFLTVPLLALRIARTPRGTRAVAAFQAFLAFSAGALLWIVPLVFFSGGPVAYWRTVSRQGAEDFSGIVMLWTTPTPRQLLLALNQTFLEPWTVRLLGLAVLGAAAFGLARLVRESRATLATLAAAFVPYVIFDLLFQETATIRYALPLVPAIAYLAVRAFPSGDSAWTLVPLALALVGATIAQPELMGYAQLPAPAFRLLTDMRERAGRAQAQKTSAVPVLAMHRREDLDLRRPFVWLGAEGPQFAHKLPAPPKHEWLELVKYWNTGGRDEVWFVADPMRTDLALIDHDPDRAARYRWPLAHHDFVGGVRPDVMDWYVLRPPGWYLGEGWALTPETAGVAKEDGREPGEAPISGWIRRRAEAITLMIGGRNLTRTGPAAHVSVAIDGKVIDEPVVAPGFFLRTLHLPAGRLEGPGDYAALTVAAGATDGAREPPVRVAIEQFDAQPVDRLVYGFGEGWQESEFNPALGLRWRWTSERATLRVHAAGHPLSMTFRGDRPLFLFPPSWPQPARVRITAGGRVIHEETVSLRFLITLKIPADVLAGEESSITIETDQTYVPAQRTRRSLDQRRLGLRVFECRLRPAVP